jgi:hypothetical protein
MPAMRGTGITQSLYKMTDTTKTEAAKTLYRGVVNQKKLKLLLDEFEQQKIKTPSTGTITAIFEKHGWSPSESQARQYKIKAEEEIRKKERAAEPSA